MILFVNACVRRQSRTLRLAKKLLDTLDGEIKEVKLEKIDFPIVNEDFINRREAFVNAGRYDDPLFALGKDFADADSIVIAAPYYDLSFPAMLKQYFEQINVLGLTFIYSESGMPKGLCKAKRLYMIWGLDMLKCLRILFMGLRMFSIIRQRDLILQVLTLKQFSMVSVLNNLTGVDVLLMENIIPRMCWLDGFW